MAKYNEPWEYYILDDFLPDGIFDGLCQLPIESNNTECDGTRTPILNRLFFTPSSDGIIVKHTVNHFIHRTAQLEEMFECNLSNSYLRIELAQDDETFWQVPHIDTLEKRITIIVYLSAESDNLGTDLYVSPDDTYHTRIEWQQNRCFAFKTDPTKWHGFTKRNFFGKRKLLLVNYVNKNQWNSLDQVWDL